MPARRRLKAEWLEDRRLLSATPWPLPLGEVSPPGSLIYDSSVDADIAAAGETDEFSIELDAGQTIAVVVDPDATLLPTVELLDPAGRLIGGAAGGAPGDDAVLQVVPATGAGGYTINVGGAAQSTGGYTAQLILNAAVEEESHDDPASAQDLDGSFIALDAQAARGAVLGAIAASQDWYRFTLDDGQWATLVLTTFTPGEPVLELYDDGESLLATGAATDSGSRVIRGFLDLTDEGGPHDYYACVRGDAGTDYSLTITRDADFDTGPGGGTGPDIQDLTPSGAVLGHCGRGPGTESQKLVSSELTADDNFGESVWLDGERAIVGTPNPRAAYVFRLHGAQWVEEGRLVPRGKLNVGTRFGSSVVISGDTAVVAAPGNIWDAGAVYVFRFDGTRWFQSQKLTASDTGEGDRFGCSVSLSGDTILIGANADDDGGDDSGSVYVFRFDGGQWNQRQKLAASDAGEGDLFGSSVSISGTTAVVGAWRDDDRGENAGAAYVFRFDGDRWIESQKLTGSDTDADDGFGEAVSISGNAALVGARLHDRAGVRTGAAYVYRFDGDRWSERQKLTAADGDELDCFGYAVSISGGVAVVGAYYNQDRTGAAYVFQDQGGQWNRQQKLTASDAVAGHLLGYSVSVSGETVIAGAIGTYQTAAESGSAYVFRLLEHDDYAVEVQSGDALAIHTATPAAGPGEFVNDFDPAVELYDPGGVLVAADDNSGPDGRNASLSHTATTAGAYAVRVRGAGAMIAGEYVLDVDGHSGAPPAFTVTGTDPPHGGRLGSAPVQITLDFSDSLRIDSLEASDLTVDGIPTGAVTVIDADTVVFDLPPGLAEGAHEAAVAGGAVVDLQGTPVEAFAARFTIDLTAPRVTDSSVREGDVLPAGELTYTARFDERLDASGLDPADVELIGLAGGLHPPSGLHYYPAGRTLTARFVGLPEDSYTLTLRSGDGALEDLVGNDFDGEPHPATTVPSGDGIAGGDFLVHFDTRAQLAAFPAPLQQQRPPGSLVYSSSVVGEIGVWGQVDSWAINLDGGQTVTVVVDPQATLQPTLELWDPGGTLIGGAAAEAAGEDALLQVVPAGGSGVYVVRIAGVSQSIGGYAAQLVLGAAVEQEAHGGPGNDEMASAEDLQSSFVAPAGGAAERGALLGSLAPSPEAVVDADDFESGALDGQWTTFSEYFVLPYAHDDPVNTYIVVSDGRGAGGGSMALIMGGSLDDSHCWGYFHEAVWTVDLPPDEDVTLSFYDRSEDWESDPFDGEFTGHFYADGVAISDDGVHWHPVFNADGDYQWGLHTVDLSRAAAAAGVTLGPEFRIKFQHFGELHFDPMTSGFRGFDEIRITTLTTYDEDWYRFSLEDSQSASLALAAREPGRLALDLYDEGGTRLAVGVARESVDAAIGDFVDATGNGGPDAYYVRVAGRPGTDYSLTLTRDAGFNVEPGAQQTAPGGTVLGYLGLAAGEPLAAKQEIAASEPWPYSYALFGSAVSISGDAAIVGATRSQRWSTGAAYVYRSDGQRWVDRQSLLASDGRHDDRFGASVAIDGEVAIVGAPESEEPDYGSAYVFRLHSGQWIQEQKLLRSDPSGGDEFGTAVAICGDRALVGDPTDREHGRYSGALYDFRYDGSRWYEHEKLTASDIGDLSRFGVSVSISGDTAIVGTYGDGAYVFHFDGSRWVERQKLTVSDPPAYFGYCVSISGGVAIAAAPYDDQAAEDSGAAYVFRFDGDRWAQEQKLKASDPVLDEHFGKSVAISGNLVLASAPAEDARREGAAYLFYFDGRRWVQQQKFTDGQADRPPDEMDAFGRAVAVGGNTVMVGDTRDDDDGVVYAYTLAAIDEYAVSTSAGDPLVVSTQTPLDGAGEPLNLLDPRVELYDPAGTLVADDDNGAADGRNATLTHTAALDGVYTVRMPADPQADAEGEYLLTVAGNSGPPIAFAVSATDPRADHTLGLVPESIWLDFNDSVLLSTLEAADLTVDGLPATAVTVLDGDTAVFQLPKGLGHGDHEVAIAGGAMRDLQATPIEPFSARLVFDLVAPRIIASSVSQQDVLPVGPLVYTARFDEELDASKLDPDDVRLVGAVSGDHRPAAFRYDPDGPTLTIEFKELPDDSYTLKLLAGEEAFGDLVGNVLDGEPAPGTTVPSGDGTPGGDFTVSFTVDAELAAWSAPLAAVDPRGSRIYDTSLRAVVGTSDDVDTFIIDLDGDPHAAQTVTLVVDPQAAWQPTVELFDPAGVSIGSASAMAPGEDAVLQAVAASGAGSYTVAVYSASGDSGPYSTRLVLGAAVEAEEHDGPANDQPATAEDLDGRFVDVAGGPGRSGAVVGTLASSEDWYRFTLHDGQTATVALAAAQESSEAILELYDGGQNLLSAGQPAANLSQVINRFVDPTIDGDRDVYYVRVSGSGFDYTLLVTPGADFDTEPNSDLATPQELPGTGTVFGYLSATASAPRDAASADGKSAAADVPAAGGAQYVPGRLIVRRAESAKQADLAELITAKGAKIVRELPLIGATVIELPGAADENTAQADVLRAAAQWSAHPAILYAEPDYLLQATDTLPDDPLFGDLWGLHNTGQTGGTADADVDAPQAWDAFTGSSRVVVASIDTGVDYTHQDLAANMWRNPGEDPGDGIDNDGNGYVDDVYGIDARNNDSDPMDDAGHGTHTSGTIGAVGDNGVGVAGVNWNVQIMATKFLSSGGGGNSSDAIVCLEYVTMMKTTYGVNVVATNNSWGGGGFSQALYDAIHASCEAGIMFVASAGNDGDDNDRYPSYPGSYDLPGIVSVAATDHDDFRAGFSSFGAASVDLGAPGVDVLSTVPEDSYEYYNGTSMAAPHVAGAVAMLMAFLPEATLAEVKAALLDNTDPLPALEGVTVSGGRLNLARALEALHDPGDYYSLQAGPGELLVIGTSTPGDGPFLPHNSLDPALELYDPAGQLAVAADYGAPDGRNARLAYVAQTAGTYVVRVFSVAGRGEYALQVSRQQTAVVGRYVFYNNSAFDGNDPAANPQDDDAIAPDKTALLPGQTASFANYTSYSRGINGIMVDVAGLGAAPTAADFEFRLGNHDDTTGWEPVAAAPHVTTRTGAGMGGSDRVTIVFDDNVIQKQWLQVTVLATENTGLEAPDVFYFGNAVGECGNSATEGKVNALDMLAARNNPRTLLDPAPIDFHYDFNRDQRVNATDMLIARDNRTHFLNALRLITAPAMDAAVENGPRREAETSIAPSTKLDWIHQLSPATIDDGPSDRRADPLEDGIHKLWATYWP